MTVAGIDLDLDTLSDWIGDRLPGSGAEMQAERIGQDFGVANALFAVSRGEYRFVLRRPPPTVNAPGASDMAREWRVLCALEGTAVPHPAPLLFCADSDVIGAPFLLISLVDGFTPVGVLPPPYHRPQARRDLGFAMVDAIADLSAVDWRGAGLADFGRPAGFLDRQVPRWMGQLARYRTRDIPELDWIAGWLGANIPSVPQDPGLIHGDFSALNVMASRSTTDRLAAVIDWDTSTIGDPLLDLGYFLARWTDPGEACVRGALDIVERHGLPRRHELAARYARRTGRDLTALPYYAALSLFKLAIILEGRVGRAAAAGDTADAGRWRATVDRLVHFAGVFARGERA